MKKQIKISNFLPEKILNSNRKKEIWPHLHVEIDKASNAVHFMGEHFIFIICFLKVQFHLCIY